jgi:hypothetical protein
MGIVYKAHDTRLDRIVAIKVLHGSSADLRQRFERAGNAAAIHQLFKLARDAACRTGRRSRIAVTESSSVVRADPREPGDLRLDEAQSTVDPPSPVSTITEGSPAPVHQI